MIGPWSNYKTSTMHNIVSLMNNMVLKLPPLYNKGITATATTIDIRYVYITRCEIERGVNAPNAIEWQR